MEIKPTMHSRAVRFPLFTTRYARQAYHANARSANANATLR
ncbi:hypothetical protein T4A_1811, partial [Trichinella pseudospiralis]